MNASLAKSVHPHLGSISYKRSKFTQLMLSLASIMWEVLRSAMHILDMYYNFVVKLSIELHSMLTLNHKEQMSLLESVIW